MHVGQPGLGSGVIPGGEGMPPAKLKVFAPNGTIQELEGWLLLEYLPGSEAAANLHLVNLDGDSEVLNRRVVIVNMETGIMVYNPRKVGLTPGRSFFTTQEQAWLKRNPQWPGILELEDQPVENGEDNEGIYQ